MKIDESDYLAHYGIIRRSGRYPWGSGDDVQVMRNKEFLDFVKDLKRQGMKESEIAKGFGMSIKQLRAAESIESNANRQANISEAQRLQDKGLSPTAIGRKMGVGESTVRSWLVPGAKDKADVLTATANKLEQEVKEKGWVDVGKGNEAHIGVSRTRLDTAIEVLKEKGYEVFRIKEPQTTTAFETTTLVLAPPGTLWKDVVNNQDKIQQITAFSEDHGRTYAKIHEPILLDPKRVGVVYGPDGGDKADGLIYIRPGVPDVSIGGARYAQVRVAVGPDHFLKGMAVYKDDLPAGTDVLFHTNKDSTGNKLDVMKKNSEEKGYIPDGQHVLLKSVRRQMVADHGLKTEHVTSAMNLVDEEGRWEQWSHEFSSQMLSKQQPKLIKTQLDMTYEKRQNQLDAIMKLTNPTVRQHLLKDFADATDSAAVHLQAAALPRTANRVLLPLTSIAPNRIYAPGFKNGEKVVLIRHPHGGKFEIPELVVDNNNRQAKKLLGNARDAVGIHHTTAKKLSGADFDGDTVLVIPNNAGKIKHERSLDGLKDFDPRRAYPGHPGMKVMKNTQAEMGMISNLITDMSLQKASNNELAQAVRHSMVVIDAEKHGLNYKLSEQENNIRNLKKKYQTGGASTLISRATAETRINERKPRLRQLGGPIDPKTGALVYQPTGKTYPSGKPKRQIVERLSIEPDARALMSSPRGTPVELLYAEHSNRLKAMANKTRLTLEATPNLKYSPSAAKAYKKEVDSLNASLALAIRNAPLERQANRIANAMVKARVEANPGMDKESLRKFETQALTQARIRTGAGKQRIKISDEEWNAIQAGAISHSKLSEILKHADMDTVRAHATPKETVLMTPSKTARATQMLADGYSRADVAEQLGVSLSTLDAATVQKGE